MGDSAEEINDDRRQELLGRISRQTATIGQRIPETINIDGDPFDLRDFVLETKSQGSIPPERRESVRTVRKTLTKEREARRERLETESLTEQEATNLVQDILGLDRAITALGNLAETDLAARSHEEYVDGTRRWVDFVDQLTD
ncbi:hypothetical protein HTSR_1889 [Halodesulfurarchaeum formicicum]|uniref:Uncharacterized protein n=1 Tax=Halodesulfurarchaeum formicicum TaxID=1873524 RepID=A0A1D8S6S3_9EURY|nr:DUF5788 family protein [Halodesulfurarchaeum formicicum]AOW81053.1 hypothetical protein HTSR_1889 [Halodesulfurarchaeum formicicum]APE96390.1 hypothetical protein HSR6_1959 [Halodesulfurarchaeum formicicum]